MKNFTTGYHLELQTADVSIPDDALYVCVNLLSVSSSSITTIGNNAFSSCDELINAYFPNVETIGQSAFESCTALTTVSLPKATDIGDGAFCNCNKLTDSYFPNAETIGYSAFLSCEALTNASFPKVTTIRSQAFQDCKALTNASFPNAITIGMGAFYGCKVLANAFFPNAETIGYSAFRSCNELTTTSFTKAITIGEHAFDGCTILTTASFPNVTAIGDYAFMSCSNLASLTLGDTPPAIGGTDVFVDVLPLLLVVPDSTVYTPIPAGFPTGSEAFNKSVPTVQSALVSGTPYGLTPHRIPTLPGGYFRWEKDGVAIPGTIGTTYQATTPGLYTLQYFRGGESVTLLSAWLGTTPYDLYGTYNLYQGCEDVLQLTFTPSPAARTIEVWSEGTGAASLYDTGSGKYFNDTLTYKLAAGDPLLTIRYAVDEDVKDGSHATFAYRIAPAGIIKRTDQFTLYAVPDIKLVTYYPTAAQFKGVLDISITNSSYYMQRSLDGGQSWQFARDTVTGEALPFSQSQIAGFLPGTTILFRVPNGCSYNSLTVGNKDDVDPFITRQVTMPSVPDAISSVDYGVYSVYSGDNFTFTLTPTGSNAGKMPHVSTSRTRFPDSEGVVITDNGDGSYTVTILQIQEAITITIDFATGTETINGDAVWANGNRLYIRPFVSGEASVYTISGALIQKVNVAAGEQVTVPLNGGIYFVKLNGKTHKIIINY